LHIYLQSGESLSPVNRGSHNKNTVSLPKKEVHYGYK
jgi:hypothetical protein